MQSRSFTPAISIAVFFLLSACAMAQAVPSPAPKVGYVRFWDMVPAASGQFEVRDIAKAGESAVMTAQPFQYSNYVQFPLGRYRLGVMRKGENTPLKVFDLNLQGNSYFTILVSPKSVELINDTNDPKAVSGTVIIRNFFAGTAVSAEAEGKKLVESLAYGESIVATGLPLHRIQVELKTKLPDGRPAGGGAEIDFKAGTGTKATILVIPDPYGRFRPRSTMDGKSF